jgi:hypothetical protein
VAIDLESIKRVRARVEASVADARAALEATNGNVDAAVARLMTPEQAMRERGWAITKSIAQKLEDAGWPKNTVPSRPEIVVKMATPTVVTMEISAAAVIVDDAPELEPALSAVPATCAMVGLERSWKRAADGSSELTVSADFHSPDPARDLASIRGHVAKYEKVLRAEVTRDELRREVVRVAISAASTDAVARTLQGPNLAGVADMFETARAGRGLPLAVRRRWVFGLPDVHNVHELLATREGRMIPDVSRYEEGWFVNPGNEDHVRVLDHDGVVSINIVPRP